MKSSGLAAVLSFFITGLGQIYNGQIFKGLVLIAIQAVNVFLMWFLIGWVTYFLVWVWGMYDAYSTAERINRTGGGSGFPVA
jgi:TM2 domain-containing membrane protein YozV